MDSQLPDLTAAALSDEILTGMHEWRLQHPDASFTEIEQALDQRWYRLRAKLLEDLALEREAANWRATVSERPTCPDCGHTLIRRGRQPRQLKTHGNHTLTLSRSYGYCPSCKKGLFPPR
jgi:predicted RNA-binding Zn-ribbon protein involved in translation (DUF1610 family)